MAMIPICESEGVANLPLAPVYESAVPFRKWVFKIGIIDNRASLRILMFTINTLGARKIALLHSSDTYGMTGAEIIMGNVNKYGASIVIKEQFEPTDTNMIPQLTKVKTANPDVIILYANAGPAAVIAKNCQQLGMETPVVGSHGIPRPEFPQLAGKIVEGGRWIIFGSKVSYAEKLPPDDPWRKNLFDPLMKNLKEKYGRTGWPATAGNAHDALRMAIEAIKISGTDDRTALRDSLEKVKFQGLMGDYAYSPTDHDGASGEDLVPIIIKDGTYWPYKK
jgi:branched-chain amino acid transport system substrate-binding protein